MNSKNNAAIPTVNILGVKLSAISLKSAVAVVDSWIADIKTKHYVCVTPVHSVMECHRDPTLREIFNKAGMITADGVPLVWLSRLRGQKEITRVYGPDLMIAVCEYGLAKNYRHYFYGGADGVPEQLTANLREKFPGIEIAGAYSPPFRALSAEENDEIIQNINATSPDIIWIGLGAPKQERWMHEHIQQLSASALIGVGAAFDFHSGNVRQAPLWMQKNGLEWVFRLMSEPRRLWRRYLYDNPLFIWHVLRQQLGIQQYP